MNKKILSAGLAVAMLFTFANTFIPGGETKAADASVNRIVFGKTYTSYDINGDGKADRVTFYPYSCEGNTCKGMYSVSMFAGEPHVQWIEISEKTTGSYYYNMKAKKASETGTRLYIVTLKNGKTFLTVNYYSKKNKYKDTHIYAYKKGKVFKKRSSYRWRDDKYVAAMKVSKDLKKSGLKELKIGKASKNMISFTGSFKNKLLGEYKADVYYGYKNNTTMVRYTSKGKADKTYNLGVKKFLHYKLKTDSSGNQKIITKLSKASVTARYKLGLYKDAQFKKRVLTDSGENAILKDGDTAKITGIYVKDKKLALYVESEIGNGYVTLETEPESDTDNLGTDGVMFNELKKPAINKDEPATGDIDPTTENGDTTETPADTVIS